MMSGWLDTLRSLDTGQWLDVILAVVVAWCSLWGLARGFLREAIGLAAVVLAFVIAGAFYRAAHAASGISFGLATELALVIWYVVLWGAVWLAGRMTGAITHWLVFTRKDGEVSVVSIGNRLAGMIFGSLKGGAIAGFIAFFLAAIDTSKVPVVGSHAEAMLARSRSVQFARDNPELLDYFQQAAAVRSVQQAAVKQMVASLELPPMLEPGATQIAVPLIEMPSLANNIHHSPTLQQTLRLLEPLEGFQAFVANSTAYQQFRDNPKPDLKQLIELVRDPRTRVLLHDAVVLEHLKQVDYARIAAELRQAPAPEEAPR